MDVTMSGTTQVSYPDDLKKLDQALREAHTEYIAVGRLWSLENHRIHLIGLAQTAREANKHSDARPGHPRKICEIVYSNLLTAFLSFQLLEKGPPDEVVSTLQRIIGPLADEVEKHPMIEWRSELLGAVKPYKEFERRHWDTGNDDWRWEKGAGDQVGDNGNAWPQPKKVLELDEADRNLSILAKNWKV